MKNDDYVIYENNYEPTNTSISGESRCLEPNTSITGCSISSTHSLILECRRNPHKASQLHYVIELLGCIPLDQVFDEHNSLVI